MYIPNGLIDIEKKVWKKCRTWKKRRGLSKWLFWYLRWCDETKITKDYVIYIIKMMMTRLLYSIYFCTYDDDYNTVQQQNNIITLEQYLKTFKNNTKGLYLINFKINYNFIIFCVLYFFLTSIRSLSLMRILVWTTTIIVKKN